MKVLNMDSTACLTDGGAGGDGDGAPFHHERFRNLSRAENLHVGWTPLESAHKTFGNERGRRYRLASLVSGRQRNDVHRCDAHAIRLHASCAILTVAAALGQLLDKV